MGLVVCWGKCVRIWKYQENVEKNFSLKKPTHREKFHVQFSTFCELLAEFTDFTQRELLQRQKYDRKKWKIKNISKKIFVSKQKNFSNKIIAFWNHVLVMLRSLTQVTLIYSAETLRQTKVLVGLHHAVVVDMDPQWLFLVL